MTSLTSLTDRQRELTRRLILNAAIEMLERGSVNDLTVRAAAKQANISERTVFRYFPSRDDFLDAVANEVRVRLRLPSPPASVAALRAAPGMLYHAFEAQSSLLQAALQTDIFHRMRDSTAKERWQAVRKLIDDFAPLRSEHDRSIAAANIRFYLAASTWHYYRFYLGFNLEMTIDCAETVISQTLEGLSRIA